MTFEVETQSLNATIRNMQTELSNIAKITTKLYAALDTLDAMWEGAAHDTFAAQYLSDQEMLGNMSKTISAVIQGLENARKKYDQCEQSVGTEIKKIAI